MIVSLSESDRTLVRSFCLEQREFRLDLRVGEYSLLDADVEVDETRSDIALVVWISRDTTIRRLPFPLTSPRYPHLWVTNVDLRAASGRSWRTSSPCFTRDWVDSYLSDPLSPASIWTYAATPHERSLAEAAPSEYQLSLDETQPQALALALNGLAWLTLALPADAALTPKGDALLLIGKGTLSRFGSVQGTTHLSVVFDPRTEREVDPLPAKMYTLGELRMWDCGWVERLWASARVNLNGLRSLELGGWGGTSCLLQEMTQLRHLSLVALPEFVEVGLRDCPSLVQISASDAPKLNSLWGARFDALAEIPVGLKRVR